MTPADARARVQRGAALLDQQQPGWAERITLDTLDISSECACVLGQLEGDFWRGAEQLFGTTMADTHLPPERSREAVAADLERLANTHYRDSWGKVCSEAAALLRTPPREVQETVAVDRTQLTALVAEWRAMVKAAFQDEPIPGDEDGHTSRWTMMELCADQLAAVLARIQKDHDEDDLSRGVSVPGSAHGDLPHRNEGDD